MSMTLGIDIGNVNDQMLTDENSEMNETSILMPTNDHQQSWFQSVQDTWSLPTFSTGFSASGLEQSAVDPIEHQSRTSLLLPAPNGLQVEGSSNASPDDVDQGDRTASSLASQSPTFSESSQEEDDMTALDSWLNTESLATKRLVQVYFTQIHPYWPILHASTFDPANASSVLLGSVIMLASWLAGELDHMKLAPHVFNAVTATLLVRNYFPSGPIGNLLITGM